jgi:hypothetical protein
LVYHAYHSYTSTPPPNQAHSQISDAQDAHLPPVPHTSSHNDPRS